MTGSRQAGRRARSGSLRDGAPARRPTLPAAACSTLDAVVPAARVRPSARRSSPDTAQLPQHVVGPRLPWLAPRETERAAVPGGRGDSRAGWSWRAVAEQSRAEPGSAAARIRNRRRPTARVVRRHQLMLKRRQHDSQRVGRRHQLMLKRRQHDHRPRERARDSQRRPSSPGPRSAAPPATTTTAAAPGREKGRRSGRTGAGANALWPFCRRHRRRQSRGDERRRRRQRRPRPASLFTIVSSTAALIVRASAWPLHPEPASGRRSVKETNPCPWTLNTEVSLERLR